MLGRAATLLRVLSHPVRLRIVEVLLDGELCVKGLGEVLGIAQPGVSQHLARLKQAGIVRSSRRGHLVCYRLTEGRAARVLEAAVRRRGPCGSGDGAGGRAAFDRRRKGAHRG